MQGEKRMTTRRDFLKRAGSAAGIVFCSCEMLAAAGPDATAATPSGDGQRQTYQNDRCARALSLPRSGRFDGRRGFSGPAANQRRERTFYCHRRASQRNGLSGDRHGGALHQSVLVSYGSGYGRQDRRGAERETRRSLCLAPGALRCFCLAQSAVPRLGGTTARDRGEEARAEGRCDRRQRTGRGLFQ